MNQAYQVFQQHYQKLMEKLELPKKLENVQGENQDGEKIERNKKYVRYKEGAALYSMGIQSFMKTAKEGPCSH